MFWETLRCGAPTLTSPGRGGTSEDLGGGLLDVGDSVFKTVTDAFRSTQRDILEEQGQDAVFKGMFIDKKFQNAACLYAFTGEWDFDFGALVDTSLQRKQVASVGFLPLVQRDYLSFDATTKPSGLTSWAYRTAPFLSAGADVSVQLELVCSDGLQCDPGQGFAGGKCDCYGLGEKRLSVPLSRSSLRKGEALGVSAMTRLLNC